VDASIVHDLATRAVDAAKAAGATYAEARLTRVVYESFLGPGLTFDSEELGFGVRALYQGAWGFAASPYWDADEAVQLARAAVSQARTNARGVSQPVEFGSYPVANGTWSTPIRIDPFALSIEEKADFMLSLAYVTPKHVPNRQVFTPMKMALTRTERAVATTEGAFFTQTQYESGGDFGIGLTETKAGQPTGRQGVAQAKGVASAGAGWELFLDAKIPEQFPGLMEEAEVLMMRPVKPVDIGRYDIVCDAATMASLVGATLGRATQLDRAMGYEANASGTSYLGPDPFKFLNTSLGSSLLTVTGDRSMAKGLATVKWDDEGVEPETFTLVDHGTFVDYQTTREQAAWLAPWYRQRGRPIRSHGCATTPSALDVPLQMTPNLALVPGTADLNFDALVANTKKGIAITQGVVATDFQSRNGTLYGRMIEIADGKLGAVLMGGSVLFSSNTIWKNLQAVGGASSRETQPAGENKGQPSRSSNYTIAAVPGHVANAVVVRNG
jgi:TldD protein